MAKINSSECWKIISEDKKCTRKALIDAFALSIQDRYDRWSKIAKNGSDDPGWPDGTNLNLVRNHICYYRKKAEKMLSQQELESCSLFDAKLPPLVSKYFMVQEPDEKKKRRLERWHPLVYGIENAIRFDEIQSELDILISERTPSVSQLSLF